MATVDTLLSRAELVRIVVPTDGERRVRWVLGLPSFRDWLAHDLPALLPGRLQAADPPMEQVDDILYRWTTGKEMRYSRQIKDLMPRSAEVWEMKTADIRIFGWIYRPCKFIAVFGDYADLYKGKNVTRSYQEAVRRVVIARDALDLDPPKYAEGTFDELVYL